MNCIQDNKVNHIYECYLLHDIINPPKRTKNLNSHYSPILHVFNNTRKGKLKFKTFEYYCILDVVPQI